MRRLPGPGAHDAKARWFGQDGSLAQFSSQVQLVEVYATVTDDRGELVTGLRQGDFEVYENNQIQDVSAFAAGEFPLTVALGVDRSWSMAGKPLELAKQASRSFLNQLKPGIVDRCRHSSTRTSCSFRRRFTPVSRHSRTDHRARRCAMRSSRRSFGSSPSRVDRPSYFLDGTFANSLHRGGGSARAAQ